MCIFHFVQRTHKHIILLAAFSLLFAHFIYAQENQDPEKPKAEDRFRAFEWYGEMIMVGSLDPINIVDSYPTKAQMRRGKRKIAKFTKLRWNIHKTYPYAVKVGEVMADANEHLASIDDKKERKKYLKTREEELFGRYEKDLRKMTRSQGKMLVKLISRQTGASTYHLIKDTKSGASAFFWQTVGRLFGINLKTEYDAEENMMIEAVVGELERGGYNIAYRTYNYVLAD